MGYARKTDRATGQSVKETGCASETVRAMGQSIPVGNTIIFQTNIDRICKSQQYSFMIRNFIPNLYITQLRGWGGFGTLDPLSINFTQFIVIALFILVIYKINHSISFSELKYKLIEVNVIQPNCLRGSTSDLITILLNKG